MSFVPEAHRRPSLKTNIEMSDTTQTRYLDDDEIEAFVGELDKNNDGYIEYEEVEHRLDLVHDEIAPNVQPHNLHHESKDDEARHRFLRSMMGPEEQRISRAEFASRGQFLPVFMHIYC